PRVPLVHAPRRCVSCPRPLPRVRGRTRPRWHARARRRCRRARRRTTPWWRPTCGPGSGWCSSRSPRRRLHRRRHRPPRPHSPPSGQRRPGWRGAAGGVGRACPPDSARGVRSSAAEVPRWARPRGRGGPVPGGVGVRRAPGRRWPRRTPGAGRARRSARRPGRRAGRHAVRPWWVSSSWGSRCPCRWRCRGWSVRRGDARRARRWALTSEQRPFLGGGLTLALLVVQTLGDLFGVTLVVQLQEAVEDLALRGRAYGVPGLAAHLVEPVVEPADLLDPVLPAVGA